jgi:hypothetical protein
VLGPRWSLAAERASPRISRDVGYVPSGAPGRERIPDRADLGVLGGSGSSASPIHSTGSVGAKEFKRAKIEPDRPDPTSAGGLNRLSS